jgi:hypothetical protein
MKSTTQRFENPFGNIFQKAQAQGLDAIASPTLPVDPELQGPLWADAQVPPEPEPTQPTSQNIKASITTESTDRINVADKVILFVELKTNETNVQKFKITIKYNPAKLKLHDSQYLDTYFTKNQKLDTQTLPDHITIEAEALASSKTINRRIASLEFEVLSPGSTALEIITKDNQSYILNDDQVNVLNSIENLEIAAGEEIKQFVPDEQTPIAQITKIPDSSFYSISDYIGFLWGIIFLVIGVLLSKVARKKDHDF